MAKVPEVAEERVRKNAPTQMEKRREYVAEHPEEEEALANRPPVPVSVNPSLVVNDPLSAATPVALVERRQHSASEGSGDGAESSVASDTANDAKDKISRMTSRERLQAIADGDSRSTVQEAARKRLEELG